MIFAVFDVLLAVNMCINYSFFTFITNNSRVSFAVRECFRDIVNDTNSFRHYCRYCKAKLQQQLR